MAVTLVGTNGLFTRLGKLFDLAKKVRTHQALILTEITDIMGQYSAADTYMAGFLSSNRLQYVSDAGMIVTDIRTAIQNTLIEMVYADSLSSTTDVVIDKSATNCLSYLCRQMKASASTVQKTTITITQATGGSNNGNGAFVVLETPSQILYPSLTQWPNIRTETTVVKCVQDSQNGAVPSGSEIFQVWGQPSYSNLDYRFPAGTGMVGTLTSVSSQQSAGPRYANVLTNGSFENWTGNQPENWSVTGGTIGTNIASTSPMLGTYALSMIGDGATTIKFEQGLKALASTQGGITPDRPHVLGMWIKQNGSVSTGGDLSISLKDSTGSILNGGTFYAKVVSNTVSSSAWTFLKVAQMTPRVLSAISDAKVVVEMSASLNAKGVMYIDEVVLAEMKQLQAGGPAYAVVSGPTRWAVNDELYAKFTNNLEGEIQTEMDRFFQMYEAGLAFPATSGAPTVANGLIS